MTAPLTGALQSALPVGASAQGPASAAGERNEKEMLYLRPSFALDEPSSGGGRSSHRRVPGAARPEGLVADVAGMGLVDRGEGDPRGGRRRGALMYMNTEKVTRNPDLKDKKGKIIKG